MAKRDIIERLADAADALRDEHYTNEKDVLDAMKVIASLRDDLAQARETIATLKQ